VNILPFEIESPQQELLGSSSFAIQALSACASTWPMELNILVLPHIILWQDSGTTMNQTPISSTQHHLLDAYLFFTTISYPISPFWVTNQNNGVLFVPQPAITRWCCAGIGILLQTIPLIWKSSQSVTQGWPSLIGFLLSYQSTAIENPSLMTMHLVNGGILLMDPLNPTLVTGWSI
jgi:hypothetical protein